MDKSIYPLPGVSDLQRKHALEPDPFMVVVSKDSHGRWQHPRKIIAVPFRCAYPFANYIDRDAYSRLTRNLRPLILPARNCASACFACARAMAT